MYIKMLKHDSHSFLHGIELQQDVAESYLSLGKLYWKMEGKWRTQRDKCLDCLLKVRPLKQMVLVHVENMLKI
jgi:hypothetical protein